MPSFVHPVGTENSRPDVNFNNGTDKIHKAWFRIFNGTVPAEDTPANPWLDISGVSTAEQPNELAVFQSAGDWIANTNTTLDFGGDYTCFVWIISDNAPASLVPFRSPFQITAHIMTPPVRSKGNPAKPAKSAAPAAKAKKAPSKKTAAKKAPARKTPARKKPSRK